MIFFPKICIFQKIVVPLYQKSKKQLKIEKKTTMETLKMITTFLGNNKKYLNYDGYIQFDKSVKNPDIPSPYRWIDGLQLDKYSGEVSVWLSTEKSEDIHSIPLKNIERNEKLLGDILQHLIETITILDDIIGIF